MIYSDRFCFLIMLIRFILWSTKFLFAFLYPCICNKTLYFYKPPPFISKSREVTYFLCITKFYWTFPHSKLHPSMFISCFFFEIRESISLLSWNIFERFWLYVNQLHVAFQGAYLKYYKITCTLSQYKELIRSHI